MMKEKFDSQCSNCVRSIVRYCSDRHSIFNIAITYYLFAVCDNNEVTNE